MASITTSTGAPGTQPQSGLVVDMVLGAVSIERNILDIYRSQMQNVEISRFQADNDQLEAPVATPTTANDSLTKDYITITQGDAMWYDTFNPLRDFEDDWKFLWSTGRLTDAQLSAAVRTAMINAATTSIGNNLEKLIWQGDTASGTASLALFDGFEKLLAADATVNDVTPAGAITASNIFTIMDAVIETAPDVVLEKSNPTFIMSHRDKQKYFEALRDASITKGINVTDGGVESFAGYPIKSCGISENKILFGNVGPGGNLKAATWQDADYRTLKVERLQNNSELFFGKALFKFGVNFVYGKELVYYVPS